MQCPHNFGENWRKLFDVSLTPQVKLGGNWVIQKECHNISNVTYIFINYINLFIATQGYVSKNTYFNVHKIVKMSMSGNPGFLVVCHRGLKYGV